MTPIDVLLLSHQSAPDVVHILETHGDSPEIRFLIADNSPDTEHGDRIRSALAATSQDHCFWRIPNDGFGAGINWLLEQADRSRMLLIANPDTDWTADALRSLQGILTAAPETLVAVGADLRNSAGEPVSSYRSFPRLRDIAFRRATTRPAPAPHLPWWSTDWLSGAFMLWRPGVLQDLGGFDQGFFMFFEDVDLGQRLRQRGLRMGGSHVLVRHRVGGSHGHAAWVRRATRRSRRRYLRKWHGRWLGLAFSILADTSDGAATLTRAIKGGQ